MGKEWQQNSYSVVMWWKDVDKPQEQKKYFACLRSGESVNWYSVTPLLIHEWAVRC